MRPILQNNKNTLFFLLTFFFFTYGNAQYVSTFAGSSQGFAEGTGTEAKFNQPLGIAVDVAGTVYVADTNNHLIRKITTTGLVSTFAGSINGYADGVGSAAQFNGPCGIALDGSGNVYVADTYNDLIRKITPSGLVSTLAGSSEGFADGAGVTAKFKDPYGMAVDAAGNVFIADRGNNNIRKITPAGFVSTVAGSTQGFADGAGIAAQFYAPSGVAVDAAGNIFVADSGNHRIRKINAAGMVSTLAGSTNGFADGMGAAAQFSLPSGVAIDAAGNVFIGDKNNNRIRKINTGGIVSTLAGTSGSGGAVNGIGNAARFSDPFGVAVDYSGNVFVADSYNHLIRKITFALGTKNFSENQVSLYPNPTTSLINIDLKHIGIAKATIFDLNGRSLQTRTFNTQTTIDISNLSDGIYLILIACDKGSVYEKIIKDKL